VRRGLLCSLVLLAACGGGRQASIANTPVRDPTPLTPSGLGIHPGEVLTYGLSTAGLDVGEIAIATGEPGQLDGRRAVIVATRGSATGLISMVKYMRAIGESSLDLETGLPIGLAGDVDWGGKHFQVVGRFDGPRAETDWLRGGQLVEQGVQQAPDGNIHSAVSAAAAVRSWSGEPGDSVRLFIAGAFRLWRTDLVWAGPETLHSSRGTDAAVRIEGAAQVDGGLSVSFTVWLTDDSDHVPLRMIVRSKLVNVTFELTSYE
jgi:hypothetical protein